MTPPLYHGNYRIDCFDRIQDIEETLWDELFGEQHPFRSHRFIQCLEKAFPKREHRYFTVHNKNEKKVIGILFASLEVYDLTMTAPSWIQDPIRQIRKLAPNFATVKIAMTGCTETSETQWWFQPNIDAGTQAAIMDHCLRSSFPKATLLTIRDFPGDRPNSNAVLPHLNKMGYQSLLNYPTTKVRLDGATSEQHFSKIRKKYRRIVEKAVDEFLISDFSIRRITDFSEIVDDLYAQYLAVHRRAEEFKRTPIPIELFKQLSKKMSGDVVISGFEDGDRRRHGFVLSAKNGEICCPFFFGRNYDLDTKVNIYYNLLFDIIQMSADNRIQYIDLGITNYFPKQNLGAEIIELKMAARFMNRFLDKLFSRYLPGVLSVEQPPAKHIFKPA